jgi:hypothetical protein
MKTIFASILLAAAVPAFAVQAILVSQSLGHSVAGIPFRVCVYSKGSKQFSRTVEGFGACPLSMEFWR